MSAACRWDEGEKLFHITSCLRDMSAGAGGEQLVSAIRICIGVEIQAKKT